MEQGRIYAALCAVMADINPVAKGRKNAQQGFMYRGIDEIMNELQPLFAKHRVFVVPEILEQNREDRETKNGAHLIYSVCKMKYTFYADDGSSVNAIVVGEGMDSGDKATNKAMAIAMKYACLQVLCIPTEEAKDPDATTPDPSKPKNTGSRKGSASQTVEEGYPDFVKRRNAIIKANGITKEQYNNAIQYIIDKGRLPGADPKTWTQEQRTVVLGILSGLNHADQPSEEDGPPAA